ncbi:MAG: RNA-binding protein [Bdellovibrionales bacterium]|nr:RNA-binding protein [Bdellovibrionales bacterium]
MNIYVGNLSYEVKEDSLEQLFADFGAVRSAKVVRDMATGKSRGFGFIEMESEADGEKAIEALNGSDFSGRKLVVNAARPKQPRSGGGGGGGGYRDRGDRGDRGGDFRGGDRGSRPPRRDRGDRDRDRY